jgi:hypothetical protein
MGGGSVVCEEIRGRILAVSEACFTLLKDDGSVGACTFDAAARPALASRLGRRVTVRLVAEFDEPDPGPPASPRPTSWRDLPPMI